MYLMRPNNFSQSLLLSTDMGTESGQDGSKPEARASFTAAEYFLKLRDFAGCYKYAARARDYDPTNPAATRLLATASVLSASKISSTHRDYYAVLDLPDFDSDFSRIGSSFEALSSILDPNANPCPITAEAFDLAVKAWSVLSNPAEKANFDAELSKYREGGTFWTMCPYCYYVYEYDNAFEDCCLRCANERCGRVLHAVSIGVPPPPDVVEKGQYCCPGFMPFAVHGSNGERIRDNLWTPFAPPRKGWGFNLARYKDCADETVEGDVFQGNGNGKRPENAGGKVRGRRKKSVPWISNKLMGRGIRIDDDQAHFIYGIRNVDGDSGERCFGGETVNEVNDGVEIIEGDDDVLVSLPCDYDLANGQPMTL